MLSCFVANGKARMNPQGQDARSGFLCTLNPKLERFGVLNSRDSRIKEAPQ